MKTPLPSEQPWYIVGLPGSGKSKLGDRLASLFGVEHVDTDRLVEHSTGRSISQIFEEEGEARFRQLEAAAVESTTLQPAVVSLGGGAVETEDVRCILADQFVIWVDADDDELLRRVTRNDKRPLLREDPESALARLRQRRSEAFQQVASIRVHSTEEPLRAVVRQVLAEALGWDVAWVEGQRRYPVVTGPGTVSLLRSRIPSDAARALVVFPDSLQEKAEGVVEALTEAGLAVSSFVHRDGELAKDLDTAQAGWDALAEAGIGRRDLVVSVGGGVTTDLAGFLAATWLRGVRIIHIPTSMLAMVDASIGGKTGINTEAGKNLVGSFHDPIAVLIDIDALATLPEEEYVAGLAEAIKTGFIQDGRILEVVADNPRLGDVHWATGPGREALTEVVRRSVAVKAQVVSEDRLESGLREILNYGHTFGHAVERAEHYLLRHGEAVAIGAVFAAELALRLGLTSREFVDLQKDALSSVGLPTQYKGDTEELLAGMRSDKKVRQGNLRFVLLPEQGVTQVQAVPEQTVRDLIEELQGEGAQ